MEESRNDLEKRLAEEVEKRVAEEVEKRVTQGVPIAIAILVSVVVTFVITVIIFKFVWAWVVPDVFPGAVAQGLISADLTWFAAVKLAVLVAALSGFYPALSEAFKARP
jgi:tetrahydromethanopterin S-methyltransferase subunit G